MNQIMCVVYDSKARVYCAPFFVPTVEVAQRAFASEANNPTSQLGKYSGDFTLFELGLYDDNLGTFNIYKVAVNHGLAANYRRLDHVRQIPQEPFGDEAQLLAGAEGGNPS